uniref:Uncharacterized protein n=1 Tax=Setaria digitata TaxID=48799 RepID=A0A915PHQ6_9BILA
MHRGAVTPGRRMPRDRDERIFCLFEGQPDILDYCVPCLNISKKRAHLRSPSRSDSDEGRRNVL